MKSTSIVAGAVASAALLIGASTQATLTLDLATIIDGGNAPSGTPPWLRATIEDNLNGTVQLTMEAIGLAGTETVDSWAFNLDPALSASGLTVSLVSKSTGVGNISVELSSHVSSLNGLAFDFGFDYPNPNSQRFQQGDTAVFTIGHTTASLTPSSFDYAQADGYRSAAHIISLMDGGGSVKIADRITTVVPEPTTYIAGVLVGLPVVLGAIRTGRRQRKGG